MTEAAALTDRSGKDAAEYGDALGESVQLLAKSEHGREVQVNHLRKLQRLTSEMIERAAVAEARLKARGKAISQLKSRLAQSQKQALSDPLTNLPNRRAFEICLKTAMEDTRRLGLFPWPFVISTFSNGSMTPMDMLPVTGSFTMLEKFCIIPPRQMFMWHAMAATNLSSCLKRRMQPMQWRYWNGCGQNVR